jgi:hypothetical protein
MTRRQLLAACVLAPVAANLPAAPASSGPVNPAYWAAVRDAEERALREGRIVVRQPYLYFYDEWQTGVGWRHG